MSEKLKPCPFCGHEYAYREHEIGEWFHIYCEPCGATGPSKSGEDSASEAWNRRHQDQSNQSEFERMLSK